MKIQLFNGTTVRGQIIHFLLQIKQVPYANKPGRSPLAGDFPDEPNLTLSHYALEGVTVIFEFLEERYPFPPLLPVGAQERSIIRMLMYTLLTRLDEGRLDYDRFKAIIAERHHVCFNQPSIVDLILAATAPEEPFWRSFRQRLLALALPVDAAS